MSASLPLHFVELKIKPQKFLLLSPDVSENVFIQPYHLAHNLLSPSWPGYQRGQLLVKYVVVIPECIKSTYFK